MGRGFRATAACALLVVGLVALFAWRDREDPPQVPIVGSEAGLPDQRYTALAELQPAADTVLAEDASRGAVPVPEVSEESQLVRARVVNPDKAGVAGATVRLLPYGKSEPVLAEGRTNAEGRIELTPTNTSLDRARLDWSSPGLRGGNRDFGDLTSELELPMAWTATLVGTVRDAATRLPINGASLQSSGETALSQTDGTYRLSGVTIGYAVEISVRSPGFLASDLKTLVPERGEHPLDIELVRAKQLRVRVVDRATSEPIPGAELAELARLETLAVTDAAGLADIDTVVGAKLELEVRAPRYASFVWICEVREVSAAGEGPAATIPLRLLTWAEGVVLDPERHPLAGAGLWSGCGEHGDLVSCIGEQRSALGLYGETFDRKTSNDVTTNQEGSFRLPLSPCDDPVIVHVYSPDYPNAERGPFPAPLPGESLRADFQLERGGSVTGQVTRNGEPFHSGQIIARNPEGRALKRPYLDGDGRFTLSALPAGPLQLELHLVGEEEAFQVANVIVQAGENLEHNFAWDQEIAWIRGTLLTPEGIKQSKAWVSAEANDPAALVQRDVAEVSPEGTFSLEASPGFTYRVAGWNQSARSPELAAVLAGTEGVALSLEQPSMLRLRLIDRGTGRAPAALEPGHWDIALTKRGETHYQYERTPPDLLGCLSLKTDPGTYDLVLHFASSGFAPARVMGVVVPDAGTSEEAVVYLDRGVDARLAFDPKLDWPFSHIVFLLEKSQLEMVEGPLSDEDGTATIRINGIRLRLEDSILMNQVVEPVEGGVRTMRGLAPGRYQLRAFPDDVVFEPESIDLFTTPEEPIHLRWRQR